MQTNQSSLERTALEPSTRLGQYEVRELVGSTSTELIYEGFDLESGRPLLINEFFPAGITRRLPDLSICEASPDLEENFARSKLMFLDIGTNLARVKYSGLAEILSTWEENNTAYRACPIYRSVTLEEYLVKNPTPTPLQVRSFIGPLLGAIETIHQADLLHLAISSTTLHIAQESNSPLLFGMGEVRYDNIDVTQKQTTVLEQAYAPIELLGGLDNYVGPCSDIYGLAAILYRLIARQTPVSANTRLVQDHMERLSDMKPVGYEDYFLQAIDRALSLKPEARPQSVSQFRSELLSPRKTNSILLKELLDPLPVTKPASSAVATASLIQSAQDRAAQRETNRDLKALLARDQNNARLPATQSLDKHLPEVNLRDSRPTLPVAQSKRPFLKSLVGLAALTSVGGVAYFLSNPRQKDVVVALDKKVIAQAPINKKIENAAAPPETSAGQEAKSVSASRTAETSTQAPVIESAPVQGQSVASNAKGASDEVTTTSSSITGSTRTPSLEQPPQVQLESSVPAPLSIVSGPTTVRQIEPLKTSRKLKTGRVNLRISPWGEVYVNGNFRGNSPPIKSISLPPGRFVIEVRNSGAASQKVKVSVASGKQTTITMKFPKLK